MADDFTEGPARDGAGAAPDDPALVVDVDGFEGPLDLLLGLARTQKVDLRAISVLTLARQYLAHVARARALRIELAADWLVMAAWLAYLKSRLLLPDDPAGDGPSAEDDAARLAFQLRRLEAMRGAGEALMARDRLGWAVFARGAPEAVARTRTVARTARLIDLLQAYARVRTRDAFRPLAVDRDGVWTMEAALERLRGAIGRAGGWTALAAFLPDGWTADPARRRSAMASTFAASLELARTGALELRQDAAFGPIRLRACPDPA